MNIEVFNYCNHEFKELHALLFLDYNNMYDMVLTLNQLKSKKLLNNQEIKLFLRKIINNLELFEDMEYLKSILTNGVNNNFLFYYEVINEDLLI